MAYTTIARDLLALLCGIQGIATMAIDLNRTHASNPEWVPHARFHLVWQVISYALFSLFEIALIVIHGPMMEQRFYTAAVLASIPMLACFGAFFWRQIYGGSVLNPYGIQPLKITLRGRELHMDLSLTAEIAALLMLLGIVNVFGR